MGCFISSCDELVSEKNTKMMICMNGKMVTLFKMLWCVKKCGYNVTNPDRFLKEIEQCFIQVSKEDTLDQA